MASLDFDAEREAFNVFYADNSALLLEATNSLRTLLSLLLTDHDLFPTPRVTGRVKDCDECIGKFVRKYQPTFEETKTPYTIEDHITDLIGLRTICLYDTDIPLVRDVLVDNFTVIEESDKSQTLESDDAAFGYKGLHLDLRLSANRRDLPEYSRFKDLRFEVQIRTIAQDAWSELDHKIKYKKNIPHQLKRRINRLAALFELADQEFVHIRDETYKLEEQAKSNLPTPDKSKAGEADSTQSFDAFAFLTVAQRHFPDYYFLGHKIDGFVEELRTVNPTITSKDMDDALSEQEGSLNKYRLYQWQRYRNRLNPYTTIRHGLFLSDQPTYARLLFDMQRNNLLEWLEAEATGVQTGA